MCSAYELLGTAVLVYAIIMSGGNIVAVVFTFFCMLQVLGPVSGGHMNPAVTFGVYIRENKEENKQFMLKLMAAQFIGAFFGIMLSINSLGESGKAWRTKYPTTSIPTGWLPSLCPTKHADGSCDD